MKYVYEGNVPGEGGENTYCPSCGELLIERYGFSIVAVKMKDSKHNSNATVMHNSNVSGLHF